LGCATLACRWKRGSDERTARPGCRYSISELSHHCLSGGALNTNAVGSAAVMTDPADYVNGPGSPYPQLEAATNLASRNVSSGQILSDGPPGSYYSDGRRVGISARSIGKFADYSQLPSEHPLHEPDTTGVGTGRTPRESTRIGLYTATRGTIFHQDLELPAEAKQSLRERVRKALTSPPRGDSWIDVHETLADYDGAPLVNDPDASSEVGLDALVEAIAREVTKGRTIFWDGWGSIENWTAGREVTFLSDVDGYRFGGCVDRISVVLDDSPKYEGVYSTELKFTDRIRSEHYLQAAAYRHVFESITTVTRPLDVAVVRIDIENRSCEIKTTRDTELFQDAWELFQRSYDRYYDRYKLVDTWLQQSANTR